MKKLAILATAFALAGAAAAAAQQPTPSASVDTAAVAGIYDLSFVPKNGEGITAQLVISARAGRYRGVITSPKLSEPEEVDDVEVTGRHVRVTALGGAYVFDFDVNGSTIAGATFTKSMNGVDERGEFTIRKLPPKQ